VRVFTSPSRAAAVLVGVTIVIAGPAVAGAASGPTLPISPAHGGPQTTFVLRLPPAVLHRADPDADLNVQIIPPPRSSRRCTPLRLPNAHLSGRGRSREARFALAPKLFAGRRREISRQRSSRMRVRTAAENSS